jgi:glutathione-regulated potassium-efflux system ancillary protein KefG
MKVLVIVAHPNLSESRINKAWVEAIEEHKEITLHRLYDEYKDRKIDVKKEQELLKEHDRIVLQFPFYWYSCPALLKEWMDVVLEYGWAHGNNKPQLAGKDLILAVTTGDPETSYVAGGYNGYTMSELLRPFQATSKLIGTNYITPYTFHASDKASENDIDHKAVRYISYILNAKVDRE